MKRILLILSIIMIGLGVIVGAGMGAMSWRFKAKLPEANYDQPRNLTEARLQDLDYLRRLPGTDNSFSQAEKSLFDEHIDRLQADAATMSVTEFTMGVAAAVAISENGHTNLRSVGSVDGLNSLPVRFFWFGDGLHIVRARASHAHLIGARVLAYDGVAPEDIVAKLDPYIGSNDHFLRFQSPLPRQCMLRNWRNPRIKSY